MLPWHPDARPEESADPHAIVVAGKHGDEYLVDDGTAEPHRIGTERLAEAWAAHRKDRFALTTIDPLEAAPDLAAGVRAATAASAGRGWVELADIAGSTTPDDDSERVLIALAELAESILPLEEQLARQLGDAIGAAD